MTSSETEREPRLLPRLTAFRWYAALAVFLYHLDGEIGWSPLREFDLGTVGVTFFFVLSGFVLTWSIRADPAPLRFYRRRFARIYPATLATGLVTAALLWAGWFDLRHGSVPFRDGALGAVTSLVLVQAWFPGTYPVYSYNPVAWTLSCEAFFYALLPALVIATAGWRSRKVVTAASACLAVGLATTLLLIHVGHGSDVAYNNPLVRLPEFILGVALGLVVLRGWRPRVPLWSAVALLLIGAAAARHRPSLFPLEDYLFLPGIVALLLSGIGSDLRARRGFLTARASVYLGEVSFCFYLVHHLVLRAVTSSGGWSQEDFTLGGGVVPAAATLGACLVAASLLHHSVELPMQRLLRPRPVVRGRP